MRAIADDGVGGAIAEAGSGLSRPQRPRGGARGTVRGREPAGTRHSGLDRAADDDARGALTAEPANGRTGLLGVIVPILYDLYFSALLAGAAEVAYEHETRLVLSPTLHEHAREVSLLDRLMHGLTDGALIVLPEESSAELELALDDDYPFVVVDPLMPLDERIPSVAAAHRSGADQAMEHLLALGHRRIAAITGPPGWVATEERLAGYQRRAHGRRDRTRSRPGCGVGLRVRARRGGRRRAARPAEAADRDLRVQRRDRARGAAGGVRTRAARARRSLGRRLRRHQVRDDRLAGAHDRPPATGRDGPQRREPPAPADGAPAARDAPHRAADPPRRPRVDRAAPGRG